MLAADRVLPRLTNLSGLPGTESQVFQAPSQPRQTRMINYLVLPT